MLPPCSLILLRYLMKRTSNKAVDDLVAWKDFDEHMKVFDEALGEHHRTDTLDGAGGLFSGLNAHIAFLLIGIRSRQWQQR
jgi:hypothetical protein